MIDISETIFGIAFVCVCALITVCACTITKAVNDVKKEVDSLKSTALHTYNLSIRALNCAYEIKDKVDDIAVNADQYDHFIKCLHKMMCDVRSTTMVNDNENDIKGGD